MEENVEKNIEKKGKNGLIALCLLITKLVSVGIVSLSSMINVKGVAAFVITGITMIPWLLISLIFAIIGRKKDKDKLSKVVLIVDIVLIVLEIIFAIAVTCLMIFGAAYLVNYFGTGLN